MSQLIELPAQTGIPETSRTSFQFAPAVARVLSGNAIWTLADQGLVSVGNFLTGLLVARNLARNDYGEYTVLLETMLFLNSLQSAFITYPLTVRGAVSGRGDLRRYVTIALLLTLALLPLLGAAMFGAAILGTDSFASIGLAASTIGAMLLWQLQETVRRALMAQFRTQACLLGDLVSYGGQCVIIFVLAQHNALSLSTTFATIGATSAVAAAIQAAQIGLTPIIWADVKRLALEFWDLGRWSALSGMTAIITSLGPTWTLKLAHGAEASANFAAMISPLKLANPIILGIGNIMVPAVARAAHSAKGKSTFVAAAQYAALGGAMILPYYALIFIFPHNALAIIFKESSPYVALAPELRLFIINMVIFYLEFVLLGWLAGLGRSRENFLAQIIQSVATVAITLPAIARFGLSGLIYGQLAALIVGLAAQVYFLRRVLRAKALENQERLAALVH